MSFIRELSFSGIAVAGKSQYLHKGKLNLSSIVKLDYISYPEECSQFFLVFLIQTKDSNDYNLALFLPKNDIKDSNVLCDILFKRNTISKESTLFFTYSEADYQLLLALKQDIKSSNRQTTSNLHTIQKLCQSHLVIPNSQNFSSCASACIDNALPPYVGSIRLSVTPSS
jgi:hypothetical protein